VDELHITIKSGEKVLGIDASISVDKDLLARPLEDFIQQYIEPAFEQLKNAFKEDRNASVS
jgi:hypothetical protein